MKVKDEKLNTHRITSCTSHFYWLCHFSWLLQYLTFSLRLLFIVMLLILLTLLTYLVLISSSFLWWASQPLLYTLGSEHIPSIPYQVSYIELCVQWKSDDDKSVPPTFTGQQTNDYVAPSECKKHTASFEQFSYTNIRGMTESI